MALGSVSVLVLDNLAVFEFGVICEVFGVDRSNDGVPNFGLSLIEWQGRPDHVFEFARFPISEDGEMVTHCLGVDDFTMIEPARGRAL